MKNRIRSIYHNWRLKHRLALDNKRRRLLAAWRRVNAQAVARGDRSAVPCLARLHRYICRTYPPFVP
jgi:hypothetical protein